MKTALLSKAALCICPPAMLATTVATVPPVRKAVHELTRPHPVTHHRAPARLASLRPAVAATPCGAPAPTTLLTLADPGPEDVSVVPASLESLDPGSGGGAGPLGAPGFVPSASGAPPVLSAQPVSPVPEPATWLMLVAGLGAVGTVLRLSPRRRFRVRKDAAGMMVIPAAQKRATGQAATDSAATMGAGALWSGLAAMRASSKPATAAGQVTAAGGKAAGSAALAKLAMCLCPPAAMIAGTAAIPTVRQAVYHATAPKPVVSIALPVGNAAAPCDPAVSTVTETVSPPAVAPAPIGARSAIPTTDHGTTALVPARTVTSSAPFRRLVLPART